MRTEDLSFPEYYRKHQAQEGRSQCQSAHMRKEFQYVISMAFNGDLSRVLSRLGI